MQRPPVGPEEETTELHGVIMFSTVSLNAQNKTYVMSGISNLSRRNGSILTPCFLENKMTIALFNLPKNSEKETHIL